MFDRYKLKRAAKRQIQGNIGVLFVCMLVAALIGSISSVVSWLVFPVLQFSLVLIYLNLTAGYRPEVGNVFDGFHSFGRAWCLWFLTGFFVMLWTMLLVVPGIVKTFAYSMAPYILADNPNMTALEALNESKRITKGAKMDLFVLQLSFLGWALLGCITCGLALIYVVPYMNATMANAYLELRDR